MNTIRFVMRAFGFAVQSAYGGAEVSEDFDDKTKKKRKKKQRKMGAIDDPECKHFSPTISIVETTSFFSAFNGIVRVCLKELLPAIYRFLRLKPTSNSKVKPESSSNWKYLDQILKKYLINFTRVRSLKNNTNDSIASRLAHLDDQCAEHIEYFTSTCSIVDSVRQRDSDHSTSIGQGNINSIEGGR